MLPVFVLIALLALTAVVGSGKWRNKSSRYFIIAAIALIQTVVVLALMYTMKMPKGKYLP